MTRFLCLLIGALVTVTLLVLDVASAVCQEVKTGELRIARPAQSGEQPARVVVQPYALGSVRSSSGNYWQVQRPEVQAELELTDEQKEKVKEIAQQYAQESREDYAGWREIPQEERREKMAEIRKQAAGRMERHSKQVEKVLSVQQMARLKDITFRTWATRALSYPTLLRHAKLSEEQQKKIQANRAQLQKSILKLQKKSLEDALKILTKEQVKKLKEISGAGS